MSTAVLVLNCGSSSVKFALIDPVTGVRHLSGLSERVGTPEVTITAKIGAEKTALDGMTSTDHQGVVGRILSWVTEWAQAHGVEISSVGHRMVHGGASFAESVLLDEAAMAEVSRCIPLAPLHNPANIAGVEAVTATYPDVPQVGVFDTAFHQTMPAVAYRYAVPQEWYTDYGVRRYGFHGTSHLYISAQAAEMVGRPLSEMRVVTAHLGNGCSLTAIKDGISVDTSMGLTPLEGVMMGTRSGDLDPGILAYIAGRTGADVDQVTDALNKRSGMLALSGVSNDLREVWAAADSGDADALLALDVFCYRIAKYVASLAVPLGGLDLLVFSGGIGENDEGVRARVIEHLGFLGLVLDAEANNACIRGAAGTITQPGAAAAVVVPTDEELVIARDAQRITAAAGQEG
ncbi:acetate/propionate family kinase [Austwickia chelonae]|uniref:acetate/propionate family kinase n=1 Tax=Austwickia chelonae TaxID=100225 RepID=UPI000E275969|nr:acetate kinase [Austwickia chelonae]